MSPRALPFRFVVLVSFLALAVSDGWSPTLARADDYAVGADLSFLADAESHGVVFKDNGQAKPGLPIFKDHGYNWIRLRLFHTPTELPNDLDYTIAWPRRRSSSASNSCSTITTPIRGPTRRNNSLPARWEGMSHEELDDAVFAYTRDTIAAFRDAGAMPDMVQIGNEVIGGMLWPDGRLPKNWDNFTDLLKAGIRGVDAGLVDAAGVSAPRPKIMIHIDRGGDRGATESFLNNCRKRGVEYDVIGQSYYPWWHGSLENLRDNLAFMANEYEKDIILVEVAYNWCPAEYRKEPGPFPETPEGQRQFLAEVDRIVRATPHGRGKGIFWWEPAVANSPIASRGMFDHDGNALPVITVFDSPRVESPAAGE